MDRQFGKSKEQEAIMGAAPTILSSISSLNFHSFAGGQMAEMFSNWGHLQLNGFYIDFERRADYARWANSMSENLCLVESGKGILRLLGREYEVAKGMAVKFLPGQNAEFIPDGKCSILSIQMPFSVMDTRSRGDLSELLVADPSKLASRVFEYEALGKEVIPCSYSPGLGLIHFVFPQDKIPLHRHPFAGRLIRTISGQGYVYADETYYDMNTDTFALFEKGVVHTNGPTQDSIYELWAVQLPWVDPRITDFEIGGHEDFVRYLDAVPSKDKWKTKQQLEQLAQSKSCRHSIKSCC